METATSVLRKVIDDKNYSGVNGKYTVETQAQRHLHIHARKNPHQNKENMISTKPLIYQLRNPIYIIRKPDQEHETTYSH